MPVVIHNISILFCDCNLTLNITNLDNYQLPLQPANLVLSRDRIFACVFGCSSDPLGQLLTFKTLGGLQDLVQSLLAVAELPFEVESLHVKGVSRCVL